MPIGRSPFSYYVRRRPICHAVILLAVLAAVCCVSTRNTRQVLVDTLAGGQAATGAWIAFTLLVTLIICDNLLWRVASWIGKHLSRRDRGHACDLFVI